MILDIIVLVMVLVALVKGYTNGLIMALFNTVSLVAGLAAAVKCSAMVAPWLQSELGLSGSYVPFVSFALVFLAVLIVIRMAGKAIQQLLESVSIGFVNRIAGAALYLLLYMAILGIVFYYLEKMGLLSERLIADSATYGIIAPWGPWVLDTIGLLIPVFKDMFAVLNGFFENLNVPQPGT